MTDLLELQRKVLQKCKDRNWDRTWIKGGCYLHLEVSEFIESLRGKGDDPPEKEAADVLLCLLGVMAHYSVSINDAVDELEKML